jgi:Na+-driven multidrug efflux pump
MSSTDSLEADSVFEDVDGIGERTEFIAQKVKNDLNSIPIAPPLVDPSIVVEEILANALVDQDVNSATPSSSSPSLASERFRNPVEFIEPEETIEAPKLSKIIKFAIPAIGVWMCSPLLSLIDTSSVGLLSGTAQQAALNPAVAVTDYSALLVAFMYTATTNLVAGAKESEKMSVEKPRTSKTLIQSLQLSGFVGMFLGSALIALAPMLLRSIIGNDGIDPEVFSAALKYVRIRALGFPAAVIIGAAQSACLGMQDIKSPMYVLLAAAVVNFFGDLVFVPNKNLWIGGAAGAAWATIFSQYAALALFLKWLQYKPQKEQRTVNLTQAILELTGKSKEGKPRRKQFQKSLQNLTDTDTDSKNELSKEEKGKGVVKKFLSIRNVFRKKKLDPSSSKTNFEESFSTRGFLAGKMRKRELLQFPPLEDAKEFWPYVIPVTTTSVGRVSAYVAMSHVVSSSLGTLSMAANQVILSVFYCLTPFADSLNLTAQSFIPGIFQKKWGQARADALKQATFNFMKAGLIIGSTCVGFVGLIPMFSKYFTSDPLVVAQVNSVVPLLAGIFSIHGLICAGEGLLLGHKDLAYLGKAYTGYFLAVPYFMLRCKKMALEGVQNVGLTSLWGVFLCYQVARVIAWSVRLRLLNVRARKEEPVSP